MAIERDISGVRFGRWTAVRKSARKRWECVCDCGVVRDVLKTSLTHGRSVSCGCAQLEGFVARNRRHGETSRVHKSPEWVCWCAIRTRCGRPSAVNYHLYGGRGIRVCERWMSFDNFLADMGRKPTPRHSIDRINNNGHYEPGNCRWATRSEQGRNRRDNFFITPGGTTRTLSEGAKALGIDRSSLSRRVARFGAAIALTMQRRNSGPRRKQRDRQENQ